MRHGAAVLRQPRTHSNQVIVIPCSHPRRKEKHSGANRSLRLSHGDQTREEEVVGAPTAITNALRYPGQDGERCSARGTRDPSTRYCCRKRRPKPGQRRRRCGPD